MGIGRIAVVLFVALLAQSATAQKVEQYCEMQASRKVLSSKVRIEIDQREERKLFEFKDPKVKADLEKVKSFNTIVDALNFLGKSGWKLVNGTVVSVGNFNVYHYIFKREFDLSELVENKTE